MSSNNGFAVNLYINGSVKSYTPNGQKVVFGFNTEYPKSGKIVIEIGIDVPETFEILLRNPQWSKKTVVLVNNRPVEVKKGYIEIAKEWSDTNNMLIKEEYSACTFCECVSYSKHTRGSFGLHILSNARKFIILISSKEKC